MTETMAELGVSLADEPPLADQVRAVFDSAARLLVPQLNDRTARLFARFILAEATGLDPESAEAIRRVVEDGSDGVAVGVRTALERVRRYYLSYEQLYGYAQAGAAARALVMFVSCDNCGDEYDRGDSEYRNLCDACLDRRCISCDCFCDGCNCEDGRCRDCDCGRDPGSEYVRDYYFKPEPNFLRHPDDNPADRLYVGIELETAAEDALAGILYDGVGRQESVLYCKHDGSIDGVEIVTHPMTYRYFSDLFPHRMFDDGSDESESVWDRDPGSGYGLHVHISRDGFKSQAHVLRWLLLLYRNAGPISRVAGRESREWASWSDADDCVRKAKGETDVARYQAVNAQNAATFEVRIFRSRWDDAHLRACVGLVHASARYAETVSSAQIIHGSALSWSAFSRWVSDRPEYADLAARIAETAI